MAHEITCIKKSDRQNQHDRITHVGGRGGSENGDGPWNIPQESAIQGIESGQWSFYVTKNGSQVKVILAVSRFGNKYLKTGADGEQPDNLLSLPECP
ncbi:DUF3892 domain-containing protein [Ramlibacter ginsenosidimutans]|uniref:DUF3892 domain-containing protein n=1 Tax=Ramlibacter ginsenosidimutans TaxID=502333 RepID=A0A934TW43_9BURK|nr:DUF3892 domain-containing protein [Ramlibacter ginsenosidimutans]MBK6008684.1 DUF3892 domain-containing protein [Ramlibacter ginsenosidimutans]